MGSFKLKLLCSLSNLRQLGLGGVLRDHKDMVSRAFSRSLLKKG